MANGPDDLGDLMQQMREGAAWAEGLVMEGHLSPGPAAAGAAGAAAPAGAAAELGGFSMPAPLLPSPAPAAPDHAQSAGAGPASASPQGTAPASASGSPDVGPATLAAVNRRQQREAEQEAAMAELQPAMRALLMHPGVAGSGQLMIPVAGAAPVAAVGDPAPAHGAPPQGLSCAAALAAARPNGGPPAWLHPQLAPPQFYPQSGPFCTARGPAPPFAYFQAAVSFMPAPPAEGSPHPSMDAAAALAWQQHQHQYGGSGYLALPHMQAPGCLAPMPLAQPDPSAASGSANASDGTTLRLRSSFESDTGGSGCDPSAAAAGTPTAAARARSGALPLAVVPQLPRVDADGCYGQPPFERQAAGGCMADWVWRPEGGGKCDAPSDSSDCEDAGGRDRYESTAQVVPEVKPEPAAAPQPLPPLPLPLPNATTLLAPLPLPAAPPHALPALLGSWGPADFPPLPTSCGFYDTPAAHAARLARHASLERYRLKKARRCAVKKIRYVKRKVNADKRPRIKGRFIKAENAADLLSAPSVGKPGASGNGSSDLQPGCSSDSACATVAAT